MAFHEGKTIFVSLAAVGDVVTVKETAKKGNAVFAEIVEVLESSPDRADASCEYFGECGGCDFMQMDYDSQLVAKIAMIRDSIERIGKIQLEEDIKVIRSSEQFGYRLRAQWHIDIPTKQIGYYKRGSRDLIDIKHCPVLAPELNEKLAELREDFPFSRSRNQREQVEVCTAGGEVSVHSEYIRQKPKEIIFSAAGQGYSFNAASFFQGNKFLIEELIDAATGGYSGGKALDLYSGVGLFTLPLASKFEKVAAVEDNREAVRFAKKNTALAGFRNVDFFTESVRDFFRHTEVEDVDFILLDPPRAGTEKETMSNLIDLRAKDISYVACEPSVLARDLKRFVENGYQITSITAIDLFPQTHHVETVVRLKLS